MKKLFSKLFRYFGWSGMKTVANDKVTNVNHTVELVKSWSVNAVRTINSELQKQITMNGFDADKVRRGELVLTREERVDQLDENVRHEIYRIGNVDVMRVTWKVNGYSIHVRPRNDSREIKKIITKHGAGIVKAQTNEDIKLEQMAAKYVDEFDKSPTPNLRVIK